MTASALLACRVRLGRALIWVRLSPLRGDPRARPKLSLWGAAPPAPPRRPSPPRDRGLALAHGGLLWGGLCAPLLVREPHHEREGALAGPHPLRLFPPRRTRGRGDRLWRVAGVWGDALVWGATSPLRGDPPARPRNLKICGGLRPPTPPRRPSPPRDRGLAPAHDGLLWGRPLCSAPGSRASP